MIHVTYLFQTPLIFTKIGLKPKEKHENKTHSDLFGIFFKENIYAFYLLIQKKGNEIFRVETDGIDFEFETICRKSESEFKVLKRTKLLWANSMSNVNYYLNVLKLNQPKTLKI